MDIKGKVHCFFEQSGTFKNEFIKLGIPSEDYDIQNNFNETDNVIDLFCEIEKGYNEEKSIFDNITKDDLILAFFPCIYFTGSVNPCYYTLENINYRNLSTREKFEKILERGRNRQRFYELITKLAATCILRELRLVIENPFGNSMHFLKNNFLKEPIIVDTNRMLRGDYFKKPTGYWFFNCDPTYGESFQNDKEQKIVRKARSGVKAGICSEERSMISSDYARNFICDFLIGKQQNFGQMSLF